MKASASLRALAALLTVLLPFGAFAEEEREDDVNCTVRIEEKDQLTEAYATAPTVEEASDGALEGACALLCVPEDGGEDSAVANEDPEEPEATESPEVEACIESCADNAIIIGTLCTDNKSRELYKDGAFDDDDEVKRADKNDKSDKKEKKEKKEKKK